MELNEVDQLEYDRIFSDDYLAFNSGQFSQLNSTKCEAVKYLTFSQNGKIKLGLIFGVKENTLCSPYSAPFGGFTSKRTDTKLIHYIESVQCMEQFARRNKCKAITVTLPPSIYNENHVTKQMHAFYSNDFHISKLDLNFQYDLENFTDSYDKNIWHNARKNLRIAQKANLDFKQCHTDKEKELVYAVIQENRNSKGYPLRMTYQQVRETSNIINADYFLTAMDNVAVAAALVFHISQNIVQVVYWGDKPGFSEYKPINYLAYHIFKFYKEAGLKFIDIGPSSENSIPNFGLCEFKESIGCSIMPKFTFYKELGG